MSMIATRREGVLSNRAQYQGRRMTPETALKRLTKQFLSLHGFYCFSILQGLGAVKGIPDIIAIRNGETLYLEVKTPKGQQSCWQVEFQRRIEEQGGKYYVIRSVEDLEAILFERRNK